MYQYSFENVDFILEVPNSAGICRTVEVKGFGDGENPINISRRAPIATTIREEALSRLNSMLEDCPANIAHKNLGICWALSYERDEVFKSVEGFKMVARLSEGWEHYSGCPMWPIQGEDNTNKWDSKGKWKGKSLALRISLIKHLISKIENFEGNFEEEYELGDVR